MLNLSFFWRVCICLLGLFGLAGLLSIWLADHGWAIAALPSLIAALSATWFVQSLVQGREEQLTQSLKQTTKLLTTSDPLPGRASVTVVQPPSQPAVALLELADAVSERLRRLRSSNLLLSERESRLQSILASMSEGVLLIDSDGQVLYANAFAGQLFDRQATEMHGRQLWEVVRNTSFQSAVELAASGENVRQEFENLRTHSLIEVSASRIEVDRKSGLVIVLHDVTQLRKLEKMRREFVSNVSHELKTPLTAIQAYADTLLEGALSDPENSQHFLNQIIEQADRLQELIQDMLRLARIEAQADVFHIQQVSVCEALEDCVEARQAIANSRDIALTYECETGEEVDVLADAEGLRTIFENLINNALTYTPSGGTVHVRCSNPNDRVVVEVEDNGIGIAKEHHDRIFERFYRVDKSRGRGVGGTGLGLAIVKHCVHAFHGHIALESDIGQGTKFRVSFPLATTPHATSLPMS